MSIRRRSTACLFAVRDPDVLYLRSVFEEPAALGQLRVEPVDDAALVGPYLLQVSRGHGLRGCDGGFVSITPDGVDIVVLGKGFQQLRSVAGHDVHSAAGQIAGVEKLVEVA